MTLTTSHDRERRIRLALHGLTCAAMLALCAPAQANLLSNGSFESVNAAAFPFYVRSPASTPGWTQLGDGVDLIHNSYAGFPGVLATASDGVQFLDMNQAGLLGGIEQVVSAVAGQTYRLRLDSTAWAVNARGGTLGYALFDPQSNLTLANGTFTDAIGGTWVTVGVAAAALSGSIGVRIEGLAATGAGMGVDNVVLAAVPEPGTYALMLAGLSVVGWFSGRRSRG